MRYIKTTLKIISAVIIALVIASCDKTTGTKALLKIEIEELQKQLPIDIKGTSIMVTDVELDDDVVSYVVELSDEFYNEYVVMSQDNANSDRNVANIINSIGDKNIEQFIKAGVGIRYIYKSSNTGETLMTIEVAPDRLKEIKKKIDNGELDAYTMAEYLQMEMDNYDYPVDMGDGLTLLDSYIKDGNAYYIAQYDCDLTSENVSDEMLQEMKEGCLAELRALPLFSTNPQRLIAEDIHIFYIYKNSEGEEFARVHITPDDI